MWEIGTPAARAARRAVARVACSRSEASPGTGIGEGTSSGTEVGGAGEGEGDVDDDEEEDEDEDDAGSEIGSVVAGGLRMEESVCHEVVMAVAAVARMAVKVAGRRRSGSKEGGSCEQVKFCG